MAVTDLFQSFLSQCFIYYPFIRLINSADKITIAMISQINDFTDTPSIYVSSKNLLMFTPRNFRSNHYTKFTYLKSRWTTKTLTRCYFFFKTSIKSSQNGKKERRFWIRKIFEKHLFLCTLFDFCQTGKDISQFLWPVIPLGSRRVEVF